MHKLLKTKPLRKDYVQQEVLDMIKTQKLKSGDRLASEKNLAEKFKVNHLTLRAAYSNLATLGILERRPGSGTYIKTPPCTEKKEKTLQIASSKSVVIAMRDDPHFFSGLRNDIINELQKNDFLPIIIGTGSNIITEDIKKLKMYQAMGIEKLIIDQAEAVSHQYNIDYLCSPECKFKNIVRVLGNLSTNDFFPGSMISGDYVAAYIKAISYLKEYGHKNIAFFSGTTTADNNAWLANKKFISLYTQAMIENNLAEHINVITATSGKQAMDDAVKILLSSSHRPSAVFCDIDYRAVKVIDIARSMGIKVPEDLSVIGFYDTPWAKHYGIDSFKFRNKEIAKAVIKSLMKHDETTTLTLYNIDLIKRNSVTNQ